MKIILGILLMLCVTHLIAQRETFDLATYVVPTGFKKTSNTKNVESYTITNNLKGTYCQIGIYASTTSQGNVQADFESEWRELIIKPYKPSTKPELLPATSENGWDAQGGAAPFEFSGSPAVAMLMTMTSNGRCVSIVILTNTNEYQKEIEKFLESVDLRKIETGSQPVDNPQADSSILGTWTMTSSGHSSYRMDHGIMNYIVRQYTFNDNGTYTFITKTFDPSMNKILLGNESGKFNINGNNITISPQKSVLESWSKKDNADKWGNLLSTQNIALEEVTYQFTRYFFSGIQEWNLVLQAGAPTKREGPFSSNTSFNNAYYYSPISTSHPLIELPAK